VEAVVYCWSGREAVMGTRTPPPPKTFATMPLLIRWRKVRHRQEIHRVVAAAVERKPVAGESR
jgi:hypothetical protein